MCNPVVFMAGATAMQYVAQRQAARRAERQMRIGEDRNDAYNQRIIDTIDENAQQYDPQTRAQNIGQAQERAFTSLRDYLDRVNASRTPTETTQGRVSEAFIADRARRAVDNANKADVVARLMARMRGFSDTQAAEAMTNADAASKVGTLAGQQINMARANTIDVNRAAQPNPALMLAGSMGQGYAMGKMINGYRTKSPAPVRGDAYMPAYGPRS